MITRLLTALLAALVMAAPGVSGAQMPEGIQTIILASDKTRVYARLARALNNNDKIVLLFHQADSNRMEYEPVLDSLHVSGFDTLTIDQRSGGSKWGFDNMTVKRRGESSGYAEAYPDLEAALTYAERNKYRTIVVVGSSYSASLAIVLASSNADKIAGVAAFSPGEYFPDKNWIKTAVSQLSVPLYVTGAASEAKRVDEVLIWGREKDVTRYKPANGVHGASTLREDQNPAGFKQNLDDFLAFVSRFR